MACLLLITTSVLAQKVEYKNEMITADGKNIAKVNKIKDKETFGLTSTYELLNLKGEKLAIATISTEFAEQRNDNSNYYYRFSFLPTKQTGIFTLSKLGVEKAFARLMGEGGIIINDQLDAAKIDELIARKGRNPRVYTEYRLVKRYMSIPVTMRDSNRVFQGEHIGNFKDISRENLTRGNADTYEISLPSGLIVAKVIFTGGENAQNFMVSTFKDNSTRNVSIPFNQTKGIIISSRDRNESAIKRISIWLVSNGYL